MNFFKILQLIKPDLAPEDCKIHFAVHDGKNNPLDVYLAGGFEEWQTRQNKQNFKRPFIVSLIQLPSKTAWLFVGVYASLGVKQVKKTKKIKKYIYTTEELHEFSELKGRLVADFKKTWKASYLLGETVANDMLVEEIRKKPITIAEFPGFKDASISKQVLDAITSQNITSWCAALSHVPGVYVITDTSNGMLYVGSATGEVGIWQRWCDYAKTGHGGNKKLKELLKDDIEYAANFHFTILETADMHTSDEDIRKRESYWKDALDTREHGYNDN